MIDIFKIIEFFPAASIRYVRLNELLGDELDRTKQWRSRAHEAAANANANLIQIPIQPIMHAIK